MAKRVLITGHNGYIGSVMAPYFAQAGYEVVGMDTGYFSSCTLVPDRLEIPSKQKDLRELELDDVKGFDAVIHLAALSNDPIGNLNENWTEEINFRASVRLAELAKAAGVERFLFSSSCIMYGMSEAAIVTEESPLDPKTEYARSKVKSERAIADVGGRSFLAHVYAQWHRLWRLSADALRHRIQRLDGSGRDHGQSNPLQRRQALASGCPRGRRRARISCRVTSSHRGRMESGLQHRSQPS